MNYFVNKEVKFLRVVYIGMDYNSSAFLEIFFQFKQDKASWICYMLVNRF